MSCQLNDFSGALGRLVDGFQRQRDEARNLARELRDALEEALRIIGPKDAPMAALFMSDAELDAAYDAGIEALTKAKEAGL